MSAEDLRDQLSRAIQEAVASGTDPDDIEAALDDMQNRVDRLRVFEDGEVTA